MSLDFTNWKVFGVVFFVSDVISGYVHVFFGQSHPARANFLTRVFSGN